MIFSSIISFFLIAHQLLSTYPGPFPERISVVKEIDLSFFLRPNYYSTIIVTDKFGRIFVTQRGVKEDFIILEPDGTLSGGGPLERKGSVYSFDITADGDPVILFQAPPSQVAVGHTSWSLCFYDGQTLAKKAEWDDQFLKQRFRGLAEVKVLRPNNQLLVRGIKTGPADSLNSLHIVDFEGNILKSFSEYEKRLDPLKNQREFSDVFAPQMLLVDENNRRIFQKFPFSQKVKVYDYAGQLLAEFPWDTAVYTSFAAVGDFLIWEYFPFASFPDGSQAHQRGPYKLFYWRGNRYLPGKEIPYSPEIDGVLIGFDATGKLYFLAGKSRQILKIAAIE